MKKNELDMDKQENDSVSHTARVRTTPRTPDGRGSSVSVGHVLGRGWGFPGENATPHDAACGGAQDRLRDLPPEDRGFSAHLPGDLGLRITSPAAWERHGGWGRPGTVKGRTDPSTKLRGLRAGGAAVRGNVSNGSPASDRGALARAGLTVACFQGVWSFTGPRSGTRFTWK